MGDDLRHRCGNCEGIDPDTCMTRDPKGDRARRYAEAIAARFTEPVYRSDRDGENEWVENPEPADRIDQTPYVMVTAGDGHRSFWTPSCAELGEVVAAVRDEELEHVRQRATKFYNDVGRAVAERDEWRERAERAEQRAERFRDLYSKRYGAIEQVRHVCQKAKKRKNAPGMWLVAEQVLAALDDTTEPDRG
ncbi:hypothetical protein [Nonomuraea sp. NPDC050643]|uniref:hypothetical protein n=1 Tax=Nonomuraea sp. NPDC050643 TaxID=3155660 RepID=UPI003409911A